MGGDCASVVDGTAVMKAMRRLLQAAAVLAVLCAGQAVWAMQGCPPDKIKECGYEFSSIALAFVDEVTESCADTDPDNAQRYQASTEKSIKKFEAASGEPREVLRASPYYSNAHKGALVEREKVGKGKTLAKCRDLLKQEDSK